MSPYWVPRLTPEHHSTEVDALGSFDDSTESGSQLQRETLTIPETAKVLGIGVKTAYEAARSGQLPVVKLGRRLVVPRAGLDRMLTGQ